MTAWTVDARLLCPWDFPGKVTGVGSHSLLQGPPHPETDPMSPASLALAGGFFTIAPPGKPSSIFIVHYCEDPVYKCEIVMVFEIIFEMQGS